MTPCGSEGQKFESSQPRDINPCFVRDYRQGFFFAFAFSIVLIHCTETSCKWVLFLEFIKSVIIQTMIVLVIESIVLCLAFTLMVFFMSRDPLKTLYNYPPAIQERIKSLDEYKDKIPTRKNKLSAKIGASVLFVIVLSLVLRYVNGYTSFPEAFGYGFLLWTIVNLWDLVVLDIIWFCHDPHFVIKGSEVLTS